MPAIEAGYLGGHPDAPAPIEYGMLGTDQAGDVTYSVVKRVNMMERPVLTFTLSRETIKHVELDLATKLKRGGSARELALAGGTGAALHKRRVGSKDTPLQVHVATCDRDYVVQFACEAHDGAAWLEGIGLADEGNPAEIAVPLDAPSTKVSVSERPVLIADELLKLAQLRDAGVLTHEEFNRQKARLLGG